jgi:hypothetical protein
MSDYQHVGARQEIAFKVESPRGTATDPSAGDWFPHTGQGFIPLAEKYVDDSGFGRIEGRNRADVAKEYAQGSVTMRLYDSFLDPLNRMIFGAAKVGDKYSVTNTNVHNSYTITTYDPVAGKKKYAMGMLNSVGISASTDEYVSISMDLTSKKSASSSAADPSYTENAVAYVPAELTFEYADDVAGLSSSTEINCRNFNLNIEKGVDIDWASGSIEPANIFNGRMTVTGDVTLTYNTDTLQGLAFAGTSKAIAITMENDAYKWEIILPSADFGDWNRSSELDGIVTETFTFAANYIDQTNGLIYANVTSV